MPNTIEIISDDSNRILEIAKSFGSRGDKGWSPVLATESLGSKVALKIVNWTGGQGIAPTTQGYIGETGIVATFALAFNINVGGFATQADLQAASAGLVSAESWSVLSGITGTRIGQPAQVANSDSGTHTDPVATGTVPNSGTYRWSTSPVGWLRIGPFSDVVGTIASGTATTAPETKQLVLLNAAGSAIERISYSDFLTKIIGEVMPPLYTFDISQVIGTSAVTLVYPGVVQGKFFLQNVSTTATVAVSTGGRTPALNGAGSYILSPGGLISLDQIEAGSIRVISSEAATPVTGYYSNTTNVNVNIEAQALAHVARYSATLTADQSTAIRTFYKYMLNNNIFKKGGRIGVLAAPNTTDARLMWNSDNTGSFAMLSAPTANWSGMTFDGVDDALDTGVLLSAISGANDHTVMVWADANDAVQGSGKYAMGDTGTRVGPNRTATQFTIHDLSSAQVITSGAKGGLVGTTRTTTGQFVAHRNDNFTQNVTVTDAAAGTNNMYVGAIRTSAGWSNGYAGKLKFFYMGPSLTTEERNGLYTAANAYVTAAAGF